MAGKHRANAEAEQQQQAYYEGQQSAAAPAPPQAAPRAPGTSPEDISRLQQLGQLHEQGVLTDDEFSRQKALILGA